MSKNKFKNPPASYSSKVWQYFGLPLDDKKSIAICKTCLVEVKYSGGTTNLGTHLRRHHGIDYTATSKVVTKAKSSQIDGPSSSQTASQGQSSDTKTNPFQIAASGKLSRAKSDKITLAVAKYLIRDMRPFTTVSSRDFSDIRECEPRYKLPSRSTFSEVIVPKINMTVANRVREEIKNSCNMAWTTDSWTSRSTESYVTITAHYCIDFHLKSVVLQTRLLPTSHTGENIGLVLKEAATEWRCCPVCLTTDNASNMGIAAKVAEIPVHSGCFAHTLNLASGKAIGVASVHHVLAKMRSVVSLFHRSTTAASLLTQKQEQLQIPTHKLIIDVKTRWNSSFLMIQQYLEQQVAILAVLKDDKLSKTVKGSIGASMSNDDIQHAETFVTLMEPMYHATLAISQDSKPTVGMLLPLLGKLRNNFYIVDGDDSCAKLIKKAVLADLEKRYKDDTVVKFIEEATALDPRFKHLTDASTWDRLVANIAQLKQKPVAVKSEPQSPTKKAESQNPLPQLPALNEEDPEDIEETSGPSPPKKKAALSYLFDDDIEVTAEEPPLSYEDQAMHKCGIYKKKPRQPSSSDPLIFWKENETELPVFSQLAIKYLCCQASSVPSERVFSTAGDIVTATRSCLDPELVDSLIFHRKNMTDEDIDQLSL